MERIILIETSTALCSTAIAESGAIVSYRESSSPKAHASMTAVFIDQMLKECNLTIADCDAVCVSMGPGSYTGLRVGVSTAKGLCFGAGKPLLAVGTLDTLVAQAIAGNLVPEGCRHIVPMIDARRMEVYAGVFTPDGRQITETAPVIIDSGSYSDIIAQGPVLFHRRRSREMRGNTRPPERNLHTMLSESVINARSRHCRIQRKTVQRRCVLRTVLS